MTGDVDLALDLRPAELRKAIATFTALGLRPRLPVRAEDFADPVVRAGWVRDRHMQVFTFLDPANPMLLVDCFAEDLLRFEDLWARAEMLRVGPIAVRVSSNADLIALKRLASRPQDLQDIAELENIQKRRGGSGG